MLWVYGQYNYFHIFSARDRLYTSESDVYRRQILKYKGGPPHWKGNAIHDFAALQSQNAVSAYLQSKWIPPIGVARAAYTRFNLFY